MGQDPFSDYASYRAIRGYDSARCWSHNYAANSYPNVGFRPVLELPTDLAADSLKIVELLTGKFMPGEQQNWINIIVKNGESFTAPAKECLTAPVGYAFGGWSDGENTYAPGESVPQSVSVLTAVWKPIEYKVNCVGYGVFDCTYGVPFTLPDADSVTREGQFRRLSQKQWYTD